LRHKTHEVGVIGNRYPVAVIVAFVVVIAIPLVISGQRYTTSTLTTDHVAEIAAKWASNADWQVVSTDYREGKVVIRVAGPNPAPAPARLRRLLDREGEKSTGVSLELVPERRIDLPPA
jgi:hypothetical protein